MNCLLKLALVTLSAAVVGGTPLDTQKRLFVNMDAVKDFTGNAWKAAKGWWSGSEDKAAAAKVKQQTIDMGLEMVDRGKQLLALATYLSYDAYERVTDPETRKQIEEALDSMSKTANDVIEAGQTIVENSENIKGAMRDSYKDLKAIAADSLVELQQSLRKTRDSMVEAGPDLFAAGAFAKDSAVALAGTLREMLETSDLVAKASRSLEKIGDNLWDFGKSVVSAGKHFATSIGKGAKGVAKASGLWKDQEDSS